MTDTITTAARRIARAHNEACGGNLSGGRLVFDAEGHGGEWYGSGSYGFGENTIAWPVGWRPVSGRDVQDWLDARCEQQAS